MRRKVKTVSLIEANSVFSYKDFWGKYKTQLENIKGIKNTGGITESWGGSYIGKQSPTFNLDMFVKKKWV